MGSLPDINSMRYPPNERFYVCNDVPAFPRPNRHVQVGCADFLKIQLLRELMPATLILWSEEAPPDSYLAASTPAKLFSSTTPIQLSQSFAATPLRTALKLTDVD